MKTLTCSFHCFLLGLGLAGFVPAALAATEHTSAVERKIGVLLVNHGSRSTTWRQALLDLEKTVRPALLTNQNVLGVKTAHMEYTEPSIATRLKEFDAEGFSDVVVVPIFLSVSSHTFDDIPTIIGQKTDPHSLETMKIEKIERYKSKARTIITPNLDFSGLLKQNVLRRVQSLSTDPAEEGLVMIAYGDATYEREWTALLDEVGQYVEKNTGIGVHSHGWCGHVAHYDPEKTTQAIDAMLEKRKKAVVIPVLVARDEMFQIRIIGGGIAKVADNQKRVVYRPDAILPDAGVEQWVITVTSQFVAKLQAQSRVAAN